ncbi:MAG TPA: putative aminohydrolase SsnA [Blastocatellia bacterium]|nr:putative aminohydrolase SsnA [Blastocatellia bacterium]
MSYLFKAATVITLDPPRVERNDLRIDGARVAARGARLEPLGGEEVIDLGGKLILPGMVCAHTHLYSALARGMPAPPRAPANFKDILELVWWRLDRALDEETIYWSAIAGALDAARAGTTCLFDHHASPSHVTGSLQIVSEAIEKVGLRGVLCYEVTDRGGGVERDRGLVENRAFLESVAKSAAPSANHSPRPDSSHQRGPMFRAMVGAHASFTLSDASLEACAELMREFGAGLHIHAAEDACDVEDSRSKYGTGVVERLARFHALNDRTILAHGIHLDERDIAIARGAGVWFAHNPRSNMNNQVGYAPVAKFGERVTLGTDGIGADMFEEARFAFFKARDGRAELAPEEWVRALANNQRLASASFGFEFGSLDEGAAADLIVLDYDSPTPVRAENIAWHFAFGLSSASVESVMVGGRFVIKDRESPLDEAALREQARRASEKLWGKL